ncbi:MAG: deoxyribodipyrimidine photo-lyase [Pseudomonadota bacterium]
MGTVYWFKRDLRLDDNPGLAACGDGPVLPLYIVEPGLWAEPDASARQWDFIAESLAELRTACAAAGAPLIVAVGEAVEVLQAVTEQTSITRIVSTEETGNGWTFARDLAVKDWARARGIIWEEIPQIGVVRRLKTRDGWAARREKVIRQPMAEPTPVQFDRFGLEPGGIPLAAELGLPPDPCPERLSGGRSHALSLLGGFLTERGRTYRKAMSSPVEGEWACSRLSPHLAFGTLSVREAAQATAARKVEVKGTKDGWSGSLSSFTSRLAWRNHFMQKLEDAPSIEFQCLHPAYHGLRPKESDPNRLHAWCAGETGLPFVDACMRYLNHTGWLNFRMRSMLMAVASYHLWLDWRATGLHLARQFTDYEPGIHWSQTQMQSGTTGMNTVRIYNPVKQGHDQDPTGVFTRRWVPELAEVPDKHLQEPWTWEGAGQVLGKRYPEPVVDVASAAKAAREKVFAVRRGDAYWQEADRIVKKHASRKSDRGFQRDPDPREAKPTRRKAAKSNDQLSLDL